MSTLGPRYRLKPGMNPSLADLTWQPVPRWELHGLKRVLWAGLMRIVCWSSELGRMRDGSDSCLASRMKEFGSANAEDGRDISHPSEKPRAMRLRHARGSDGGMNT